MKIILLSARAQAGKDTSAKIIKEELEWEGKKVLICHYADLLKYMCKAFFGWNGLKDDKGRSILQYVGTDIIREQQPNYWVDFIISVLQLFKDDWDYVLIPDTRFPNEIDNMKEVFGKDNATALRVKRDGFDNGLTDEQKNHPSEIALNDYKFDYYLDNSGTMDDLRKNVEVLLHGIY